MEEVKQHPRSKRKRKNINVYFNKTKSTGQTKYITGEFQSNKCNSYVPYRSSYELRFFHLLEKRSDVISYEVESIEIPYKDLDGNYRKYIPDALVLLANGDIKICEIKPEAMLDNVIVNVILNVLFKSIGFFEIGLFIV